MSEFADKVVLVTGGTRGIGRACAEMFAREGAKLAICGRSDETSQAAAEEIKSATGASDVHGYGMDTSDSDVVKETIKKIEGDLGAITILVNNAGITRDGLLMRMKDADWDAVLNTNLKGCFNTCRAVARGMMKARAGRIINVSSIIGVRGGAGQTNYAAAKAGLIGFTKSLAQEMGSRGITANIIAPGYIGTDMTADFSEDMQAKIVERVPLGRVGDVEDIAAAVKYLAGDGAAYVTGAILQVDGGLAM